MPRRIKTGRPKRLQDIMAATPEPHRMETDSENTRRQLQGSAEEIVARVITAAQNGDMQAARIVLDKVLPAKKDAPVIIDLPPISSASDAAAAISAVITGVSNGSISLSAADTISKLIKNYIDIIEVANLEARIISLEIEVEKHASKISRQKD